MCKLSFRTLLLSLVGSAAIFASGFVSAQDPVSVSLSNESGAAGDNIAVDFSFTGNGQSSGVQVDFTFDDTNIDSVDFSNCLNGSNAAISSCQHPGGDTQRVRINLANDATTPLTDFTGTLVFAVSNSAPGGTIPLTWEEASFDVTDPTASVNATDGSIQIATGPSSVDFTPNPGATIDFGSAEQNGGTSTDTVQICNDGSTGSVLNVGSVSISPSQFTQDGGCDGAALEAGATDCCTINMTFAPDGTGNFSGTLNVETDAEGGEGTNGDASFTLDGEGVAGPAPSLSISPTSWMPSTDPGTTAGPQTFTVENSGDASSEADIGTVALATGSEFTITTDNCSGTTLNGGDTCTIDAEFSPATAGTFVDTLDVPATDAINGGDVSLAASLEGTGNGPIFSSTPNPGTVTLGSSPPGGTLSQDVVISNDGNEPLDANCGTLNDPSGVFSLNPSPADFSGIAAGGSATFSVSCDVNDVTTYEATLQCSTNENGSPTYDYTFRCVGQPLIIPTMQPWGLVLLTLLMLAVGGFSIRFFRA